MAESNWNFAHASVIGTSHIEKGTECQDRYDYRLADTSQGETLIVVMSDGAGSSEFSQVGAERACNLFIQEVENYLEINDNFENLNKEFGLLLLESFRQWISDFAEEQEREIREYACTLLAGVIWKDGAVFYQVGDGGIIYSTTGEPESFCFGVLPATKEYANATDFITEKNAGNRLLYEFVREPIKDLVMFTDGIERIAINFQSGMPHEPFLLPMLAPLHGKIDDSRILNEKLTTFLNSPRINEKTDDDKTLFLASRFSLTTEEQSTTQIEIIDEKSSDNSALTIEENLPEDIASDIDDRATAKPSASTDLTDENDHDVEI